MRSFHCLGSSFVAFHLVPLLRGEEETSLLVFFVLAFSSPSSMFSRSQTAAEIRHSEKVHPEDAEKETEHGD